METTVTVERVDEDSEFLPSQEILRENLKKKPSRKKPAKLFTELRCGQCGKILSDRASLRNHIQTHSTACPFQCRLCSYKGKTRKYLLRHMNRAHREPSKLVNCGYCDKTFRFMSKLKVHERVHTGEKPYKCDVCGKAFNSAYSLSTHNFIHTDEKPFKCTFCDYACRDSSTLRKHQERHLGLKRHKCQICTKRYDSKSVLEAHIREIHTAPEARNHACGQCDSTFRNKWALQRHKALVHERKKACECSVCGKHIPNSYNLSAHMRSHVDVRPYKCTYNGCKASFKNKSDLKKHTSIHYPQKQVACDHCGKLFSRKNRLMKHILKIHDAPNTKSERCEYCGVSFLTKNYLSKHIRMKHARNRQKYICDMCDFETHNKPSIVMHIKHGHDYSNKTKCTICGKTYKREVALKLHYKSSHNIQFKTKSRAVPKIQIKEEPLDPVPDLEIDLLDIGKEEPFAGFETEYSEDISKIYQPSDDKDQRLHELFRRMIHDPDYELNGTSETQYQTNTTKVENRTPEPAHSAMPLEELIQQDLVLLVVGERRPMSRRESTNNTTEAETRTDDPPQNTLAPPENIEQVVSDGQSKLNENELTESNNNTTKAQIEESPNNTTEETQLKETTEKPTNMTEAETRTEGTTESPTNMPEAETRTEGTAESPTNMPEAETRTEAVQTAMPVEEFIQRVVGDGEDTPDIDETYIIDKESDMFLKQRIKELIMNQRLVDQIRRTDYGRRTLKRVAHDAKLVKPRKKVSQPKTYQVNTETKKQTKIIKERKTRRKRKYIKTNNKRKNDKNKTDSNDNGEKRESNLKKDAKLIFNSFECNVCYKLFETKPKLLEHCQSHFEICSESTLIKCPLCNFVADKDIKKHFKTVHHEDISISFLRILDRKQNESGSRYYYNTQNEKAKEMDIIPSVKILNKKAGMDLDKRNREKNNKLIATPKLVKKGNEWIVAKQKFDLSGYVLPNSKELDKDDEDYLKKLKKLGIEAKDKGVKMLYPCNKCEKICQNLSALTLHSRKHNPDKKPFAPKVWKHKIKDTGNNNTENGQNNINNVTKDINNRTAKPKPIVNKHKCDPKLIEFYETNIRGLNIEFWQFLKIYNKMDRDNVNDFKDLQNSDDYGLGHRNYLEDQLSNDCNSTVDDNKKKNTNNENTKMNTKSNNTHNKNKKSLSVASRKSNVANVKNNFTRTIRISRTEHNKRMQVQKKLREKLTQTGNV